MTSPLAARPTAANWDQHGLADIWDMLKHEDGSANANHVRAWAIVNELCDEQAKRRALATRLRATESLPLPGLTVMVSTRRSRRWLSRGTGSTRRQHPFTGPSNTYRQGTGTSDVTAIIAAAAALVRSKYPSLSAKEVYHRLTAPPTTKVAGTRHRVRLRRREPRQGTHPPTYPR